MTKRKTIELVEESILPKALIINGGEISSFLEKTLVERGCSVVKKEGYSPSPEKFNYIFLFDNYQYADDLVEKHLTAGGKFILVDTTGDSSFTFRNTFKILTVGDPSSWDMPELAEKILRALFSGNARVSKDIRHKQPVSVKKKTPNIIPIARINAVSDLTQKSIPEDKKYVPPAILEKTHSFNFRIILKTVVILIFAAAIAAGGFTYWYFQKIQKTFADLNYHLRSASIRAVADDLKDARQELEAARNIYTFTSGILFPLKDISYVKNLGTVLVQGEKITTNALEFTQFAQTLMPAKSGFDNFTDNITSAKLTQLRNKTADLAAVLIDAQAALGEINKPYFPGEKVKATLSPIITKLTGIYEILPVAQQMFFQDGSQVYLVLLQNNMELRPTGGFIGSYGLLTVSGGKISDFKIEDVYTADGQLKGHVDPPLPIRKYLSQPNFFLRDSNFDPDFAASAVQAAWFLQKEIGKSVDGVIAVNLTLAQKLMQVVGPVSLPDFNNEQITADNFFPKIHSLSQTDFFPGSTQKKDVLTAVANSLFTKLGSGGDANFFTLMPVVKQALEEKNILLFVEKESVQKAIEEKGWAGRMVDVTCTQRKNADGQQEASNTQSCLPDYLSIVEANLGVNKANYFINKSTVVEKKLAADGTINTMVTVSYENKNSNPADQSQIYTNYLRFFVPAGSKLASITLNNAPVADADIDNSTYGSDKTIFGLLVRIAPNNRGVVKINYTLPRPFAGNISVYQLFFQKQAGDKNSPLIFSMTYPPAVKLNPVNFSSATQQNNEIYYTTDTSVDRVFAVKKE